MIGRVGATPLPFPERLSPKTVAFVELGCLTPRYWLLIPPDQDPKPSSVFRVRYYYSD